MSPKKKKLYRRTHRRRSNNVIRFGKAAVRAHEGRSGRTGSMHHKKTPSSKHEAIHEIMPNRPFSSTLTLG